MAEFYRSEMTKKNCGSEMRRGKKDPRPNRESVQGYKFKLLPLLTPTSFSTHSTHESMLDLLPQNCDVFLALKYPLLGCGLSVSLEDLAVFDVVSRSLANRTFSKASKARVQLGSVLKGH